MTSIIPETAIPVPIYVVRPAIIPEADMIYESSTNTLLISNGSTFDPVSIPAGILPVSEGGTGSGTALVGGKLMVSTAGQQIVEGTDAVNPSFSLPTFTSGSISIGGNMTLVASVPGGARSYNYPDSTVASTNIVMDTAGPMRITNTPAIGQVLTSVTTNTASWATEILSSVATQVVVSGGDPNVIVNTNAPGGATGYGLVSTSTANATWQQTIVATGGSFNFANAVASTYFPVATSGTVAAWGNPAQLQTIFFGKAGNDVNSGTSVGQAVATLEMAFVRAAALVPGVANIISVVGIDGATYTPAGSLVLPDYTVVTAPGATLVMESGRILTLGNKSSMSFYRLVDNNNGLTVWGFATPDVDFLECVVEATYFSGSGGFSNASSAALDTSRPYVKLNYVDKTSGVLFALSSFRLISADVGVCYLSATAGFCKLVNFPPDYAINASFNFEIKTVVSTSSAYLFDTGAADNLINTINVFSGQITVASGKLWNSGGTALAETADLNSLYITVNGLNDSSYTGYGVLQINDSIHAEYITPAVWFGQVLPPAPWNTTIERVVHGRTITHFIVGWYYGAPPAHNTTYISMPSAIPVAYAPSTDLYVRMLGINGGVDCDATAKITSTGDINIYYGADTTSGFPTMVGGGFYSFSFAISK